HPDLVADFPVPGLGHFPGRGPTDHWLAAPALVPVPGLVRVVALLPGLGPVPVLGRSSVLADLDHWLVAPGPEVGLVGRVAALVARPGPGLASGLDVPVAPAAPGLLASWPAPDFARPAPSAGRRLDYSIVAVLVERLAASPGRWPVVAAGSRPPADSPAGSPDWPSAAVAGPPADCHWRLAASGFASAAPAAA